MSGSNVAADPVVTSRAVDGPLAESAAPPPEGAPRGLWMVVRAIAERIGRLGIEVADIAGRVDQVTRRGADQNRRMGGMGEAARATAQSNARIGEAAAAAEAATAAMAEAMAGSQGALRRALEAILGLADGAGQVEAKLSGLPEALDQVSRVSRDIERIARQTNLLALNATIEAARAGEAGHGFAVVANEVKALSRQTAEAVTTIQATVGALGGQVVTLLAESWSASAQAAAARAGTGEIGEAVGRLDQVGAELGEVAERVAGIARAAAENGEHCRQVVEEIGAIGAAAQRSQADLEAAQARTETLLTMSEDLIGLIAEAGVETVDTPYIRAVVEGAEQVSAAFERAIEQGALTLDDLFDEDYQQMPGIEPAKYVTRFTAFVDEALPTIIEPAGQLTPKVVGCGVCDRNGYHPVATKKYSQPPTSDSAWNALHSRHRVFYKDRTAVNQLRSTRPFLVQTYRRDMGERFDLMKDISAPILVRGRRWGNLRMMVQA